MVCSLHRFPVPHKQVRFNVFFSLRPRTRDLSTGMEGRATEWQLLPASPQHGQGDRDGKMLNCLDSEKAAKKGESF